MRRLLTLSVAAVLMLGLGSATVPGEYAERRDGNWWRTLDADSRKGYMTGFFDGILLGHRFSYWKFIEDEKQRPDAAKVQDSFEAYYGLMNNITNEQFVEGLNTFYSDYRNRRIVVVNAVWIVLNTIGGKSDKDITVMIENFRKNAGQ